MIHLAQAANQAGPGAQIAAWLALFVLAFFAVVLVGSLIASKPRRRKGRRK